MQTPDRLAFLAPDLSVRLISLPEPINIATIATGQNEHWLLVMLEGNAELIFEDEIVRISPSIITFINGSSTLRAAECLPAKLWVVRFTDRFARDGLYSVNADVMTRMLSQRYYGFYTEPELFKIIKKLLLLLDRHWRPVRSENSEAICKITFNLLCNCLQEGEFPVSTHSNVPLSRKELVSAKFFSLVANNAMAHHDVKFYADKLCMTRGNLGKIIKKVTGRTPKSLIEEALVSIAIDILGENSESIHNLSEILGFKSSSAFISFFRLHTGSTPNDYRNRNRNTNGM